MAIVQITVVPLGTETPGLSRHLEDVARTLAASALRHEIHPMGSVVEGPVDQLMALAARLHEAGFAGGAHRVMTQITLDDRRDVDRPMEHKVERFAALAGKEGA